MNDYEHLKGPTATLKRCTPIARDVDGCLAPPFDLPPWQLAAAIANRPKPPRIRQSLHRCRVMLRVNALVEPIVFHPGVFARLFEQSRSWRQLSSAPDPRALRRRKGRAASQRRITFLPAVLARTFASRDAPKGTARAPK